jgi:hypothetical protein
LVQDFGYGLRTAKIGREKAPCNIFRLKFDLMMGLCAEMPNFGVLKGKCTIAITYETAPGLLLSHSYLLFFYPGFYRVCKKIRLSRHRKDYENGPEEER